MIAAIVLAAGQSKRMGRPKQLLPLGRGTILGRVLQTFRSSKVDRIVVVLGSNASRVRRGLSLRRETVVVNKEFSAGMSASLKAGLMAVEDDADAVVIALGDQPFVSPGTVDSMIDAYHRERALVVVPVYRGRRGNPVLFDRRLFPQLKRIAGDLGAKSVVMQNESSLVEVEVDDEGVAVDIDTPDDYARRVSAGRATGGRKNRGQG